jgi:hypothetical protein
VCCRVPVIMTKTFMTSLHADRNTDVVFRIIAPENCRYMQRGPRNVCVCDCTCMHTLIYMCIPELTDLCASRLCYDT